MVLEEDNFVSNGHFEHVEGEVDALQICKPRRGRPQKHQTQQQQLQQGHQDTAAECENGSDYDSHTLVLKTVHSQLTDAQGGIGGCLFKALKLPPSSSSKDPFSVKAPAPSFGVNQLCQHAFFTFIQSDKFASFCKLLLSNFNGINPHTFFDYNLLHTRIKEGFYELHPTLFSSDLQKVWRKAQMVGTEMVSLSESLLDISRASCSEQLCTPDGITKEEQVEAQTCGEKENDEDCSACNQMYHENCVVCVSLNARATVNNGVKSTDSTDSQTSAEFGQSNNDSEDSCLCKMCETDARNGERLRICSHSLCPSKYYHVRCLTNKQLKSYSPRWYCPSCLCRVCLNDKDDPKIILCDGCDYAYHIYCVQPPLDSIPKGEWFCQKCDYRMQEIRKRRRLYESTEEGNNHGILGKDEGVDMLLNAANTLNVEEKCASILTLS